MERQKGKVMNHVRKKYSQEFKQEAVELVPEQGYTIAQAAESLGIRENMLWRWKKAFTKTKSTSSITNGTDRETPEAELRRLREENRRLRMEREILKKAAVFFAKETE